MQAECQHAYLCGLWNGALFIPTVLCVCVCVCVCACMRPACM